MTPRQVIDPMGRKRRRAALNRIGGFWPHELMDITAVGRKRVVTILEEHDRMQRNIKMVDPQHYSRDLHVEIHRALTAERKALDTLTGKADKIRTSIQLRFGQ